MSTIEILEPRIAPAAILHGHHLHALKQKKLNSDSHDRAVKFKLAGIKTVAISYTSSGSVMEFYGGSIDLGFGASVGTTRVDATTANAGTLNLTSNNVIVSGAVDLTKAGAGTLVLNAGNTFEGSTTVNPGQLIVNGDPTTTSPTNPGTISVGTLTISGGTTSGISAGTVPGNLVITGNPVSNGTTGTIIAPVLTLGNPVYSGIATIVAEHTA